MKVLFFMRSTVYVRNFDSTLRLLAERGHYVHVAAERHEVLDTTDLIGRLSRQYPTITYSSPPSPQVPQWVNLGVEARKAIDYLRYLEPEFREARKLRLRAEATAPVFLDPLVCQRLAQTGRGRSLFRRLLRVCNRAVPPDAAISAFIRQQRPDIVIVTPLVEPGSPQSEYLRSARALGIPTGLCVYSWDNLTSKGLIHDALDIVTVWNDAMKAEAVALHRVPEDRVVVTGATPYDHWFAWTPRTSRQAFCSRVGLSSQHPYLLYLCSSRFIAGNELPFVRRWVADVRGASGAMRGAGVLVRPHPQNAERWQDADFSDLENVAVWPRDGGNPVDDDTRANYYDSIYHSAAVVGINTSALIESAIVGRGVFTLLAPEFRDTQDGTLHFRHLRDVNGGVLHIASDLRVHVSQLEAALHNPVAAAAPCRRFVEAFVRPHGSEKTATPRLADALEAAAARGAKCVPAGRRWRSLLLQRALHPLAQVVDRALQASLQEEERIRTAKRLDQQRRAAREQAAADEAVFVATAATQAFANYLRVRDQVHRLRDAAAAADGLTPCEQRMLAALEPLWNAGPDTISALRRQTTAVGGVAAAEYEEADHKVQFRFERDLRRLLARGDAALWIDEPSVLGTFGFSFNGRRFNEDTLRFFRVVSLLQDAALIKEFRDGTRRTVWEIGGGWGGFAHHFKQLCPNVTYLITGRPELFLLSAVYLMTLFPAARFRFYDPATPADFWGDWDGVDFAFAPESAVGGMAPPSLDLTVDLMALERMSPSRVCAHVQRAYELGSRYIVSIGPSGDPGRELATAVRPALERLYWRHPVCAPASLARRLSLSSGEGPIERTYFLGWKRLHA